MYLLRTATGLFTLPEVRTPTLGEDIDFFWRQRVGVRFNLSSLRLDPVACPVRSFVDQVLSSLNIDLP